MPEQPAIKGLDEHTKICAQCRQAFIGGKRAQYCSVACRVAALRQRRTAGGEEKA
jgi:hypothetical protein